MWATSQRKARNMHVHDKTIQSQNSRLRFDKFAISEMCHVYAL